MNASDTTVTELSRKLKAAEGEIADLRGKALDLQSLVDAGVVLDAAIGAWGSVRLASLDDGDGPDYSVAYKPPRKGAPTRPAYRGASFVEAVEAFRKLAGLGVHR